MALETLKSSCSHYDGRRLWLGKAALRSRLVDVRGWRGGRRFRDSIPLEEVESVARSNSKVGGNLVFAMKDGSERGLRVSAPGIWRMQIDYRLRRIAGLSAADPREATTAPPVKVETSLPTADEVEHTLPLSEGGVLEEGDTGTELAAWPRFESEDATIEIVGGVDLEPEFLIEPVAVSEDGILVPTELDFDLVEDSEPEEREDVALVDALSFEIEAEETEVELPEVGEVERAPETELVPVARIISVPPPEDLHEIGDDVVFDLAMDATTHEDVVIGWLSPIESEVRAETPVADVDAKAESGDAERLIADMDAELEVELPIAEMEVELTAEAAGDIELEINATASQEETVAIEIPATVIGSVEIEVPTAEIGGVLDTAATDLEAALQIESTDADLDHEAKPLIARIVVEAPDLEMEAGLEVEAPDLEMEAGLEVEAPELEPEPAAEVESEPAAEVEPELVAEVDPELVAEVEPNLEAVAEVEPEPEIEASIEVEPEQKARIGIASRPFELSRLYETAEPEEVEPEPLAQLEAETEAEASTEPEPTPDPVPELSLEPATKRERRRPQTMADLRPMSLAELIRQSEPRWTRLAEMD